MNDRVHAVVVSWNPGPVLDDVIAAIAVQVHRVVLVDNGSSPETRARLDALATRHGEALTVLRNAENRGLAAAQNQGIATALDDGAGWVLLLDHDSVADPRMIETMLAAAAAYPEPGRVGLLAPVLSDKAGTLRSGHWTARPRLWLPRRTPVAPGTTVDDVLFVIASGSLIPASVLRRVGGMREAFFVDYVDFDFSFRLLEAGYRLLAVGGARLDHRLGEPRTRLVLGRPVTIGTHSAARRFTIYRNRTRLWREVGWRMPGFVLFELGSVAIDIAKAVALEDDRAAKLVAILQGIAVGLFGRASTLRS